MKGRLAFLLFAICFVFFVLAIGINKRKNIQNVEEKIDYISDLDFLSKDNITLLRTKNGKIDNLNLNYYMLCVVASEMPFKFEFEALKSQAVVARTYLYNKIINNTEELADVCDSYAHCQAFMDIEDLERIWKEEKGYTDDEIKLGEEKIKRAILETDGQIITYNGQVIDALFHSSSYMKTENSRAIWNREDVPYLQSVDSVEHPYDNSQSECEVSFITFKNTLIDKGYVHDLTNEEMKNIAINSYTESGRVKDIRVGGYLVDATDLRTMFGLKSTYFSVITNDTSIFFEVKGFGHGVGMSQVGADTLAKQGKNYIDIIQHYYTGVEITKEEEIKK